MPTIDYAKKYAHLALRKSSNFLMADSELACMLGVDEAIFLGKIGGWCHHNMVGNKQDHFVDGEWWTYNTYQGWLKDMPYFRNIEKIKRLIRSLEEPGYLVSMTKPSSDRTKWYRVDSVKLGVALLTYKGAVIDDSDTAGCELEDCDIDHKTPLGQNDLMHQAEMHDVVVPMGQKSDPNGSECSSNGSKRTDDLYTINKPISNPREREEQNSISQELSAHLDTLNVEDDPFQGYIPIRGDTDWHYNQSKHKLFPWRSSWAKRAYDKAFCAWLIDNAPGVAARCKDIGRKHGMGDAIQWLTNKEYKEDGLLELLDLWEMYQTKDEVEIEPETKTDTKPDTQTYLNQNGFSNLWDTNSDTWSEAAKEAALIRVNSDRRHDTKLSSRDAPEVDYWLADRVQFKDLANLTVVSEQADKVKPWVDKEYQSKRFYAFQKKAREITDFRVVPCEASDQTDNLKPITFTYWCTLDGKEPTKHVPFNEHDAKYLLGEWVSTTKQYREHLAILANVG